MTASVVTFSVQVGGGGTAISRAVAEKLSYRYYDWEIISQAAQEAGVSPEEVAVATSERSPGLLERVMSRLAVFGAEDDASSTGSDPSLRGSDDYRQFIEHVVRELAGRGDAVIVNRAGQAVLSGQPGVLKVLVFGSPERRAIRYAANQGLNVDEVRKMLTDSDRQRSEYLKRAYHVDWLNCANYDLAINTDRIDQELATDMVVAAARDFP